MKKWKTISSKIAFDNPWFKVRQDQVELPNGKILDDYLVWLEGEIVLVVPVTQNNEFVLVKQYKHAYGDIVIEFPAGYVNEHENILSAAQRELREETGYGSDDFILVKTLTNLPTKVVGSLNVYVAKDVKRNHATAFDHNEDIEILVKSYQEVLEMITKGEIVVSGTIAAAFLACKYLNLEV
jgi:ADP-ribose pyrophosphatase